MWFETSIRITVYVESLFTTDETFIVHILLSCLLIISQLCKRLNNDTEHNIQLNALHTDEEADFEGPLDNEPLFVILLE